MNFNLSARPRHFAACFYTIVSAGWLASAWLLLTPCSQARGQVEVILEPGYELRTWFLWHAIIGALTICLAACMWWPRGSATRMRMPLALLSLALAGLALWCYAFDVAVYYAAASGLVVWDWLQPGARMRLWPVR